MQRGVWSRHLLLDGSPFAAAPAVSHKPLAPPEGGRAPESRCSCLSLTVLGNRVRSVAALIKLGALSPPLSLQELPGALSCTLGTAR